MAIRDKARSNGAKKVISLQPRLSDVAEEASVAASTVSAVLANRASCYASKETRQRIFQAIDKLGYRPNRMAQGLRGQGTNLIGVVFQEMIRPAITTIRLSAVEDVALKDGFRVIFGTHRRNAVRERDYIRELLAYRVDGLIIYNGLPENEDLVVDMVAQKIPVVVCDSGWTTDKVPIVDMDREQAGYLQVRHLMQDAKREKIAFLVGSTGGPLGQAKLRGYAKALAEVGSKMADHLMVERPDLGDNAYRCGVEMLHEALNSGVDFDAVLTTSDSLALGAMSAIIKTGRRVPEDIAVIGFDDEDFTDILPIPLSTIHQPRDLGVVAYELLKDLMSKEMEFLRETCPRIIKSPELVARESTKGKKA